MSFGSLFCIQRLTECAKKCPSEGNIVLYVPNGHAESLLLNSSKRIC